MLVEDVFIVSSLKFEIMKKLLSALFALVLSCTIYAQTAMPTAGSAKTTITGTVEKDAYQLKGAPAGMSDWVIDITTNGKTYRNGISAADAVQINNLRKNGKKPTVTIVRANGAKDEVTIAFK